MPRRAFTVVAIGAVLAACGISPPAVQPAPGEVAPPAEGEPIPDVRDPEGTTINDLMAYGAEHADTFGGLWIDPPGGTAVVMAFTADLDAHHAAVNRIVPGTRVVAVANTKAALDELQERLTEDMFADGVEPLSVGVDERRNVVVFELKTNDPTLELRMEATHGGMLDVIAHPIPGPWANVEAGQGWRLLATGEGSPMEAYVVRAARTAEEWDELWETLDLSVDRPQVNLDVDVVVSFAEGIGSGCREVRLDDIGIEDGVVFSVTSDPLAPRNCTDDLAGAAVFVIALERAALPDAGFTLRLRRDPANFSEELDVVLP